MIYSIGLFWKCRVIINASLNLVKGAKLYNIISSIRNLCVLFPAFPFWLFLLALSGLCLRNIMLLRIFYLFQ